MSFQGALTSELLDRAESAAQRPVDRAALERRARELGIGVTPCRADAPARELLARLRGGAPLDPRLASLLRDALARQTAAPLPDALADVAEWIGAGEAERGRALRDVLRLYGAIAGSRDAVQAPRRERFPRFETHTRSEAS